MDHPCFRLPAFADSPVRLLPLLRMMRAVKMPHLMHPCLFKVRLKTQTHLLNKAFRVKPPGNPRLVRYKNREEPGILQQKHSFCGFLRLLIVIQGKEEVIVDEERSVPVNKGGFLQFHLLVFPLLRYVLYFGINLDRIKTRDTSVKIVTLSNRFYTMIKKLFSKNTDDQEQDFPIIPIDEEESPFSAEERSSQKRLLLLEKIRTFSFPSMPETGRLLHFSTKGKRFGKAGVLFALFFALSMTYGGDFNSDSQKSLLPNAEAAGDTEKNNPPPPGADTDPETLRAQQEYQAQKEREEQKKADAEIVQNLQLLKELKEREEKINAQEEELKQKEARISSLQESLDKRIEEMKSLRLQLEELIKLRADLSEKNIRQLVKVYENMKPAEAAQVISNVDRELAIQVLLRMKGKKAGKILGAMKPKTAILLSDEISKRR